MDKKVLVCIPVYKAQRFKLLDYIAENPIDRVDYYYITQENDDKKDVYEDRYKQYPHMHEYCCVAKNIQEKRYAFYNHFIKEDYDYMIMLDDDILPRSQYIDGTLTNTKNSYKCKRCEINKLFNELINVASDNPETGIFGFTRFGFLGNAGTLEVLKNKSICFAQFILINFNVLRKHPNVNFTKDVMMMEDIDFGYKAIADGVPFAKICYMAFIPELSSTFGILGKKRSSLIYTEDNHFHDIQLINTYKKFGGALCINKKNQIVFTSKPSKYINVGLDHLRVPFRKSGFDKELDTIVFSKPIVDEDICNKVFKYLKK